MGRKVTESVKKRVAASQQFQCATITDYVCPFAGKVFDESGYDIDHIHELIDSNDNSIENLQALCINCHRVKTTRFNSLRKQDAVKEPKKPSVSKKQTDIASNKINYHVLMQQIKSGFDKLAFDNYGAWNIIQDWANKHVQNIGQDSSRTNIVQFLGCFQWLRGNCEPRQSLNGNLISGSVWNEIDNYVMSIARNAENGCDFSRDLLKELRDLVNA